MSTNTIRAKAIEAGLRFFDDFARITRPGKNAKVCIGLHNVHPTKVGDRNEVKINAPNFFIPYISGMITEMNCVLKKGGLTGDIIIDIDW